MQPLVEMYHTGFRSALLGASESVATEEVKTVAKASIVKGLGSFVRLEWVVGGLCVSVSLVELIS